MKRKAAKLTKYLLFGFAMLAMFLMLYGCSGSDGTTGATGATGATGVGATGATGATGTGTTGATGATGAAGGNVRMADFHGTPVVTAEDEVQGAPANPKYLANIKITGATADAAGLATVTFTVKNKDNVTPVAGLTVASAAIFKLAPKGNGLTYNKWVPYIYRPGRTVNAGYRESTATAGAVLTETGPGTYSYTFATNLLTATRPFAIGGVSLIGYDRTLTHRASVYLGGHAGPTGEADFDFVPDGVTAIKTRNIVETATCKKCHGPEFAGHGGDRVTVEGCNTCHSPDSAMVNAAADGGTTETIEMAVMIHKMHAGRELASAPGADGIFFDDPATIANEAADNGKYTVGSISATWRSAAFPAVLANCQACHTEAKAGTLADLSNWKTVPSRAACGSCHDNINWATGANHSPSNRIMTSDDNCFVCHPDTGAAFGQSVTSAHDFTNKDIRNISEFNITVTTDTPSRGYYIKGETPVVSVVLKDAKTGVVIDHSAATVFEQVAAAEGCTPNADLSACTNAAVPGFRSANMYVTGPRASRIPVLTMAARAKLASAAAGPWDLSAGGASLRVVVDSGKFIVAYDAVGEDRLMPGDFTVKLPAPGAALNALFANSAAATPAEVVAWLNGPTATFTYNARTFKFSDRAIAYVDDFTSATAALNTKGFVAIRTRGLATTNPTIQVPQNDVPVKNLGGMFTDGAVKVVGAAVQLRQRANVLNNDPKFAQSASKLTYTLDPVDDLAAGTYMINVEFGDRMSSGATTYRTPSVGLATFQVKQAAAEKSVADNCNSCHMSPAGVGFVMDFPRHHKLFDDRAVDHCGGCHMYKSGETAGVGVPAVPTWTTGGGTKPISKRVHAVHNGSALNYPVITVDHEESLPGRNWKITYPMDIRNCESCHSAATSGTWKTNPNRLACMGCHDSDSATAHIKLQTFDPTPTTPWSGDEKESCAACH